MSEKNQPFDIFKKNGGIIYIHENYQYTKVRMFKSGATYLRCTNYKRQKCKASITFKVSTNHITPHYKVHIGLSTYLVLMMFRIYVLTFAVRK